MEGQEGGSETSKVMIGPQLEGLLPIEPSTTAGMEQQSGNESTSNNGQGLEENATENVEQKEEQQEGTTSRKRTHEEAGLGEGGDDNEDGPQQKQ